jgi:hypothetical protein
MKILLISVAFFVELWMLVLLSIGGYHSTQQPLLRLGLTVVLPILAILVWSKWLAPKSADRMTEPGLSAVKLILFMITTIVSYLFISHSAGLAFFAVSFIDTLALLVINKDH